MSLYCCFRVLDALEYFRNRTNMTLWRNIMNIIEFRKRLAPFPLVSLQDVRKAAPDLPYRQLDRWAKKDYLSKVHRGFYLLAGQPVDRQFLFHAANRIYQPSYVSLEAALKYYGSSRRGRSRSPRSARARQSVSTPRWAVSAIGI